MSDPIRVVAENDAEWGRLLELPAVKKYQNEYQEPIEVVGVMSDGVLFEVRPPGTTSEENDSGRT